MSAREVAADASRVAGEGTAADAVATTDSPAPLSSCVGVAPGQRASSSSVLVPGRLSVTGVPHGSSTATERPESA